VQNESALPDFSPLIIFGTGMFIYIVEYLLRVIAHAIKTLRSRQWPVARAAIKSSSIENQYVANVAEIHYTYSINGAVYSGAHKKPFIFKSNAELYVEHFSPGTELNVRVKPDDPRVSFVREDSW
jgi:hypothetical protein